MESSSVGAGMDSASKPAREVASTRFYGRFSRPPPPPPPRGLVGVVVNGRREALTA